MAELVACWKCHQPMLEKDRCKNCGATFGTTRTQIFSIFAINVGILLILSFSGMSIEKALAFVSVITILSFAVYGLLTNLRPRITAK